MPLICPLAFQSFIFDIVPDMVYILCDSYNFYPKPSQDSLQICLRQGVGKDLARCWQGLSKELARSGKGFGLAKCLGRARVVVFCILVVMPLICPLAFIISLQGLG